jgi:hypothetical protein
MKEFLQGRKHDSRFSAQSRRVTSQTSTPVDDEEEFDPTLHGTNGSGSKSKILIIIALLIAIIVIVALFLMKKKQEDKKVDTQQEVVDPSLNQTPEPESLNITYADIEEINEQSKPGQPVAPMKKTVIDPVTKTPKEIPFTPAEKTSIEQVKAAVTAKRSQVETLYRKATAVKSTSGVVKINLDLSADGKVRNFTTERVSGDLSEQFMSDLDQMVKNWTFNIKTPITYEFKYRLSN